MATAAPYNDQSTHHVVLTKNATSVGLVMIDSQGNVDPMAFVRDDAPDNSLRVYSGVMKHHDRDSIFEPIAQTDWSGGRGSSDFDKDASKYGEGVSLDTTKDGKAVLAGFAAYTNWTTALFQRWNYREGSTFIRYAAMDIPRDFGGSNLFSVAQKFRPTANINPAYLYVYLMKTSDDATPLTFSICSDTAGAPGAVLYSGDASPDDLLPQVLTPVRVTVTGAGTLNAGTDYWIKFGGVPASTLWGYLIENINSSIGYYESVSGGPYAAELGTLYFRLVSPEIHFKPHFFEYKGSLWAAMRYASGIVGKVFINGDQGVATGVQGSLHLEDTTKTWATDQWKGAIVRINRGTGSDQPRPWRLITANTATRLTIDSAWDVTPTTGAGGTEYSIVATDVWTEVTGHGWVAQVVTDVLSVNGAVYFCHGDSTALTRLVRYNNAGVWTSTWATETGQYTFLLDAADQVGNAVWGAKGGYPAQIARAPAQDWTAGTGAANLAFATAIGVGNMNNRITGLNTFTDYGNLHVLTEGALHQVIDSKVLQYNARALRASSDYRNGRASLSQDTFLYFSWHNSLIRYFKGMMDRIGPDAEEVPLPANKTGPIMALTGYSNLVIAAFDAGPTGYSTIMAYNGHGWCEWYRAPAKGMRIWSLFVQSIPGDAVDRLWFGCGSDLQWMPLSVDPANHPVVSYNFYSFAPGAGLVSAWLYNELNEVLKYWDSVELTVEQGAPGLVDEGGSSISYQVDQDVEWAAGSSRYSFFNSEVAIGNKNVAGYRLRVLISLFTLRSDQSPVLKATVVEAIKRLPKFYVTTFNARLADGDTDLLGNPDEISSALTKFNTITTLESAALPVSVSSVILFLNGRTAFVDLGSQRPIRITTREGREIYAIQVRLVEV